MVAVIVEVKEGVGVARMEVTVEFSVESLFEVTGVRMLRLVAVGTTGLVKLVRSPP